LGQFQPEHFPFIGLPARVDRRDLIRVALRARGTASKALAH
jgi:hypothetical protein